MSPRSDDPVGMVGVIDDAIPVRGDQMLPVVGLGGSAGSLAPLQIFFERMPANSGMAFVVILHLSPEHESLMAEILQRSSSMPVIEVHAEEKVEANRVYVIPPGKHLSIDNGKLHLSDLEPERGRRVAVDLFLRTLAEAQGQNSIGIVLSGADADGAIGIKRIKERGGLTIAQEPSEAEHTGMPRAAIATGMVDWVLPVREMPERLIEFLNNEGRIRLLQEATSNQKSETLVPTPAGDDLLLREVISFLRGRTGRDFTWYKHATILRRIRRRMQLNGIESLRDYLGFLRNETGEPSALVQDFLVSVSSFFRDHDAFEAFAVEVPRLFKDKKAPEQVRVWVPGCATGEEAYSLAILLSEHAVLLSDPPSIQVFATDLHENSLRAARQGLYPETIVADVSEERLREFFIKDHGGYRVRREVREMVLFAFHDLTTDAPFSQLDLISCRNLLIYLNENAQKRAMDIFHFGLRTEGLLFLGLSESVGEGTRLFAPLKKKHRLYIRRTVLSGALSVLSGPPSHVLGIIPRSIDPVPLAKPHVSAGLRSPQTPDATSAERETSLGALHLKLIESISPPSLVVDSDYNVIHLSERAGRYLQFSGGKSTLNLLAVVHPILRIKLRTALYSARQSAGLVKIRDVPVEINGALRSVSVQVSLAQELAPGFFLVVFEEGEPDSADPLMVKPATDGAFAKDLEEEIDRLKEQLRDTIEQHKASDEEMKASNEELQAMNEELRAASEELETGREELQSINEELITVNQELKNKVDELGRANSDLQNLMASTNIATIFLDRSLRITRYTPAAVGLFNLIPSDVGRPLSDLRHQLKYDSLVVDAQRVLEQLGLIEREVRSAEENWFLVRLLPYRTIEERIAGLVLTLVDITERKRAEELLQISEARFRSLVNQSTIGIARSDTTGKFTYVNERYCEMTGRKREELLKDIAMQDITHPDDLGCYASLLEKMFTAGQAFVLQKRYMRPDGADLWVLENVTPILNATDRVIGGTAASVDITERKHAEAALEKSRLELEKALGENEQVRAELEEASRAKDNFLAVLSHEC